MNQDTNWSLLVENLRFMMLAMMRIMVMMVLIIIALSEEVPARYIKYTCQKRVN